MGRPSRKPQPLSDLFAAGNLAPAPDASPAGSLFEAVPGVMRKGGRVEGFEALRDLLLENWRSLAGTYEIPLQALLKLVLETDRHALFAMLSEEKLGDLDQAKMKKHRDFQKYLEGEIESSPVDNLADLPGQPKDQADGSDEDVQG